LLWMIFCLSSRLSAPRGPFPRLADCAHFHYENVDFGHIQVCELVLRQGGELLAATIPQKPIPEPWPPACSSRHLQKAKVPAGREALLHPFIFLFIPPHQGSDRLCSVTRLSTQTVTPSRPVLEEAQWGTRIYP
jgi:hypothetical protein